MVRRIGLGLAFAALVLSSAPALAVGKYCLAFWRETGFYEKGGIGGNHVINVHVWDENGNPVFGKHVYTGTLDMGTTDSNGQIELAIYEPNAYPLKIVDGSNLSDITPGFSSTRAPDWGHYCFECGFVYVSDSANAPAFDLTYDGIFNSSSADYACNNIQMSAPRTRSMAFCSTRPDAGYYCSDGTEAGGSAASVGQTFKATGNRVVACKFSPTGGATQYVCRIREGGPSGAYVGSSATSRSFGLYDYAKTLVEWGLSAVPVTPGGTYFLEIKRLDGASFSLSRVVNNNDPNGCYYEGTTANTLKELRGEVVCATVGPGPSTGTISGTVRDTGGAAISGAAVATGTGGYTATTNASGAYSMSGVATGTYSVTASKSGYTSQTLSNVVVQENQTTTANFSLAPNWGTISGYVRDGSGGAISGASVSTSSGGYSATSGADGSYSMAGVAAGTYDVTASKAGYLPQTQTGKTVTAGQTTTVSFSLTTGVELLTNGSFTSGCTGWSHSESPSGIYWGCGNKAYPGIGSGSGGASWNAYLSCGGYFCDRAFTGEQHQDNVAVTAGAAYYASAQVYYEPVKYPDTPNDQKERLVLVFNNGTTHTAPWHTHTTSNGWDLISYSGTVPAGAASMTFRVELSHTDGQWSGTGAVDECSFRSATGGTISGTVRNSLGTGISGASVSTSAGGYAATTNASGVYTITGVTTGVYNVIASKPGYNTLTQIGKSVTSGATTTVDFTLTDATAPSTPVVVDDGLYTTNAASLHASWSASDPETGVAEYRYCIGTSPGLANVVGWTSTGATADVTRSGLSLGYSLAYYFSVIAKNADGLWSATASSDGIRVARTVAAIAAAKAFADGDCVRLSDVRVTAAFGNACYVEDAARTAGIKVTGAAAVEGTWANVTGVLATVDGERVITNAVVE